MTDKKPKKKLIKKLKNKYRLIIYNDKSYEEVWSVRLSRLNVLSIVVLLSIFLIVLTTIIIAFTPLRQYVPGYPNDELRKNLMLNYIKIDSLEKELTYRDNYLSNIKDIIEGREPRILEPRKDTVVNLSEVNFKNSSEDSIFRAQVEEEEKYNIGKVTANAGSDFFDLYKLHFFPPVKGMISDRFNLAEGHFGTDIVANANSSVCSVLDGTVIASSWTFETGYIVQVQHQNDLISVYKHNAQLLKKEGQIVKLGEPIAIYGNTGELSTGPHLHFELWHKGKPLNPELFISFK